jgi:hypothetical protein
VADLSLLVLFCPLDLADNGTYGGQGCGLALVKSHRMDRVL